MTTTRRPTISDLVLTCPTAGTDADHPARAADADQPARALIGISGIVQGVGFRPFVFREAKRLGLFGSVINTSAGVTVDVEGTERSIAELMAALRRDAPPRARITSMTVEYAPLTGRKIFVIGESEQAPGLYQLVSPDSCTCGNCLAEMRDPGNRRYHYPFINCTDCGPRFTIIEDLPYDRAFTTMKRFEMCPRCRAEYEDPLNRRFHAEPNACPECGPRLWLADRDGVEPGDGGAALCDPDPAAADTALGDPDPVTADTAPSALDPVAAAAAALRQGQIVALKGLGGFQLACLASDEDAVARLRRRKRRPHKPFAVMIESVEQARRYCHIDDTEQELLESVQRPIVLLRMRDDCDRRRLARGIAPRLGHLGLMLPCAPLHFLLMEAVGAPLIMTSGNRSEEPICRTNSDALARLGSVADIFLLHDRGIRSAYDDSVLMVSGGRQVMLRRARGYAPLPVELPADGPPLVAAGAQLKNTFCLARGRDAFVSQHIGDLEDAETLGNFERNEALFRDLFDCQPQHYACDLHPDYLSTAWCRQKHPEPLRFQHHRAHIAACLGENSHAGPVIGVALDGTGFGDDSAIWGGEFFTGSLEKGLTRSAHLEYFPLLGGEAAIHEPWRTAMALCWKYAPEELPFVAGLFKIPEPKRELLARQLASGLNCPPTSSCGRLFDAVAALALGRLGVSYEAQAAIELEAAAAKHEGIVDADGIPSLSYRFALGFQASPWILSPRRAISRIISDVKDDVAPGLIAWRFHAGLAEGITRTAVKLAERHETGTVALSGGVLQNRLLAAAVAEGLRRSGLRVLMQRELPPNDGCLSYGQAVLARYTLREV